MLNLSGSIRPKKPVHRDQKTIFEVLNLKSFGREARNCSSLVMILFLFRLQRLLHQLIWIRVKQLFEKSLLIWNQSQKLKKPGVFFLYSSFHLYLKSILSQAKKIEKIASVDYHCHGWNGTGCCGYSGCAFSCIFQSNWWVFHFYLFTNTVKPPLVNTSWLNTSPGPPTIFCCEQTSI